MGAALVLLVSVAWAGPATPLQADKTVYAVAATGGMGIETSEEGGNLFPRVGIAARVSRFVSIDGSLDLLREENVADDSDLFLAYFEREPYTVGVGAALDPLGTGLHGPSLGVRVRGGPAFFDKAGGPVPEAPPGARVEILPNVRGTWIGHPGVTLSAESGPIVAVCCNLFPSEPRLGYYAAFSAGFAIPSSRPPRPADVLAGLDEKQVRTRRAENHAVDALAIGAGTFTALFAVYAAAFAPVYEEF